jgi:TusA-related sulfurtransferase
MDFMTVKKMAAMTGISPGQRYWVWMAMPTSIRDITSAMRQKKGKAGKRIKPP